jgi:hypothetical protein
MLHYKLIVPYSMNDDGVGIPASRGYTIPFLQYSTMIYMHHCANPCFRLYTEIPTHLPSSINLIQLPRRRNLPDISAIHPVSPPSKSAKHTWLLVLCPLTGKCIACLLPLYVPISLNRLILSFTSLLNSFSIFIFVRSAVSAAIVLLSMSPTLARGKMWCFARMREECCWPMP